MKKRVLSKGRADMFCEIIDTSDLTPTQQEAILTLYGRSAAFKQPYEQPFMPPRYWRRWVSAVTIGKLVKKGLVEKQPDRSIRLTLAAFANIRNKMDDR